MFKHLEILSGPVHAKKSFDFSRGETAIVGPNGCGKSLLAEYLAFALFGSCALRGKVSDYKDLEVKAKVEIKGRTVEIHRSTKDCEIKNESGQVMCLGTKPCNLKIISLLGYDYNVYKMGNYAEQLDILGLGKMKPSERKTALDRTLGIGIIDKLIKYAGDTALKHKHTAEAILSVTTEPGEAPVKPEGYTEGNLNNLADKYGKLKKDIEDYREFLKKPVPTEPIEPVYPLDEQWTSIDMVKGNQKRIALETELLQYRSQEEPKYTEAELIEETYKNDKYQEYQEYLKKLEIFRVTEEPQYSSKESVMDALRISQEWRNYESAKKAFDLGTVKCPGCGKLFNPYKEMPTPPTESNPNLSESEANHQILLIDKKKAFEELEPVEPVEKPNLSYIDISNERVKITNWEKAQERIPEIEEELVPLGSCTLDNIHKLQSWEKSQAIYEKAKDQYSKELEEYQNLLIRYQDFDLDSLNKKLENTFAVWNAGFTYENELKVYQAKMEEYLKAKASIETAQKEEQRYRQACENLKEMKIKIKGYVLPSLQKVSSILLSEMSDGQFERITIDPEFNILVEGREINLFSGSEQAMINLALRLGLGQVLTHKAFSVFIGDEIDASMRDERAQLTADCLRKISKYIKQVILISHRDITADQYIELN